jgi:Rrf2 family protein
MLRVSRATDYALLFLTNLAERPDRKWSVREASEELKISRRYLANIIHQLARKGIIRTTKGAGGGVTLERRSDDISIGDVVELFEGSLSITDCLDTDVDCERSGHCRMHSFWRTLSKDITEQLNTRTLEEFGELR